MGLKRTAQDITVGTQLGPVTVEITADRVRLRCRSARHHPLVQQRLCSPYRATGVYRHAVRDTPGRDLRAGAGGIHASQEFELLQPLMLGSTVTARGTVVDKFVERGHTKVIHYPLFHAPWGKPCRRRL